MAQRFRIVESEMFYNSELDEYVWRTKNHDGTLDELIDNVIIWYDMPERVAKRKPRNVDELIAYLNRAAIKHSKGLGSRIFTRDWGFTLRGKQALTEDDWRLKAMGL